MFKNTDINIFKANNTIYQQLAQKAGNRNPSGIYEIKCNTCSKNYVGQSGRPIIIQRAYKICSGEIGLQIVRNLSAEDVWTAVYFVCK